MNETNKQLIGEVRQPLPTTAGDPARVEHEYKRNGVAQIFLKVEPLSGQQHVEAGERRTRRDWALWIAGMLETRYRQAERVVLVMDNLTTHGIESLYATFAPAQARRLAERLEIHYTPKHGSWLTMAENELSALLPTMPQPPHSRIATDAARDRGRGSGSEQSAAEDQLEFQDSGRSNQAGEPVSNPTD